MRLSPGLRAALYAALAVLFVTGFADMAHSEDSRHETVLQKPFRAEELTAKVAEVLG